jgi:dTDP-4-dehydrorhamnose reductase
VRCLVIGADGKIGRGLSRNLIAAGHSVYSTTRRLPADDAAIHLDLTQPHSKFPEVDVAFFCTGLAGFEACRSHQALARQVNVAGPLEIARELVSRGTRVVRLSSSAVFTCLRPTRIDDEVSPRSVYGQIQLESEQSVLQFGAMAAVIRFPKIVDRQFPLMTSWLRSLAAGKTIQSFVDHGICPVPLDAALDAIQGVGEKGGSGVYQASGTTDISYFEFARWVGNKLGVSEELIVPVRASDCGILHEEVMPFTSMDTSRLEALLGFVPQEPKAVFAEVFGEAVEAVRANLERASYAKAQD